MPLSHCDYTVACICPMGVELAPVKAMLDQLHPNLPTQRDQNNYTLGEIEGHKMVIAVLPEIGTNSAATVAIQLLNDFPSIRFGLLVGIGGGVPDEEEDGHDIRLGDVVVSKPTASFGGGVQYDLGKYSASGGFERTGVLAKPPALLRASVEMLAADHRIKGSRVPQYLSDMLQKFPAMGEEYSYPGAWQKDQLFQADYRHPGGSNCYKCDKHRIVERDDRSNKNPKFHYGTIGSANTVVKDASLREELRQALKIICVEMEAAGLMDSFPCLVIRGICDYADSHKNKKWQPYAAATAAAYMKELLSIIPPKDVAKIAPATGVVQMLKYDRGLNLFDAPDMSDGLFIGRDTELEQMENILLPESNSSTRKVLILGGMGGIGKTQLAVLYAKRHSSSYSSIFWLNATSETTLKSSLRSVANRILPPETVGNLDDDQPRIQVSNWLSELDNTTWLLVFDNYDDPDQYNITKYYSSVAHGSIIITTRQPRRINGHQVKVESMTKLKDSLDILATRSGRQDIQSDLGAHQLAQRLDGFPLALATAGAFLKESSVSFSEYLQQYEAKWVVVLDDNEELPDYPTRTLYTTWDLSFNLIKQQNPLAAKLLAFFAYLDHQDIWYTLLCAGQGADQPAWFVELISDKFSFESAMRTLTRYCLVESHHQTESYSLHVCVHDWTLNGLNRNIDRSQYMLAFNCVAGNVSREDWENLSALRYRRLTPHAVRLAHERFQQVGTQQEWLQNELTGPWLIAGLLYQQVQYEAAERLYLRVLGGHEKALGPEHTSTLRIVNNLGVLYKKQGKMAEAEEMYVRALRGYKKALGSEHTSTLDTVNNLGNLYSSQGKIAEAEEMYVRALRGYEKVWGPEHTPTLDAVNNIGILYYNQGKMVEAEEMYVRALRGLEKALGPEHMSTLDTVNNLGILYTNQGKMAGAEEMYIRALRGKEKVWGPVHTSTLDTVNNLGILYKNQGKMAEAEEMYVRALRGKEKVWGPEHTSTLDTVNNLGNLYYNQCKITEAEEMYVRALRGCEKACGPGHTSSTLNTVNNLGNLYTIQGKTAEAEEMYVRALRGYEKAAGKDHPSTQKIARKLQRLHDRG